MLLIATLLLEAISIIALMFEIIIIAAEQCLEVLARLYIRFPRTKRYIRPVANMILPGPRGGGRLQVQRMPFSSQAVRARQDHSRRLRSRSTPPMHNIQRMYPTTAVRQRLRRAASTVRSNQTSFRATRSSTPASPPRDISKKRETVIYQSGSSTGSLPSLTSATSATTTSQDDIQQIIRGMRETSIKDDIKTHQETQTLWSHLEMETTLPNLLIPQPGDDTKIQPSISMKPASPMKTSPRTSPTPIVPVRPAPATIRPRPVLAPATLRPQPAPPTTFYPPLPSPPQVPVPHHLSMPFHNPLPPYFILLAPPLQPIPMMPQQQPAVVPAAQQQLVVPAVYQQSTVQQQQPANVPQATQDKL